MGTWERGNVGTWERGNVERGNVGTWNVGTWERDNHVISQSRNLMLTESVDANAGAEVQEVGDTHPGCDPFVYSFSIR